MAVEPTSIEPMFALLEIMLRSITNAPKVKPGGHPEEIFLDLSDDEREEIECSICFQILKDTRLCENKHKFCYSCIFVWSTSGNPVNHSRCPVCRVGGLYSKNAALDEKINARRVKCTMATCKWTGALSDLASHQHTTYSPPSATINAGKSSELPVLRGNNTPRARASPSTLTSTSQESANSGQSRRPLANVSNNTTQVRPLLHRQRQLNTQSNATSTSRSRTRSRSRQNSSSPQRRSTVTATGLPSRLTSRARVQNGGETTSINSRPRIQSENVAPERTATVGETVTPSSRPMVQNENPISENAYSDTHTPRPPATARPQGQHSRRLPTLPSLVNGAVSYTPAVNQNSVNTNADGNNNVDPNGNDTANETIVPISETPRRYNVESAIRQRHAGVSGRGFGAVRDRLNESRLRLDLLMNAFSNELDQGRQDLTAFQIERERRRQEQLAEVRDLGRRLGQVATELRGLLSQRRQIRHQIDNLVESATDDSD